MKRCNFYKIEFELPRPLLIYLQTKLHVKYFCFQTNHMLCFAQPVVSSPPSHQQVGREKENSFLLLHNLFIYCMFFRYL